VGIFKTEEELQEKRRHCLSFVLAIGIIGDLWLATTRTNNNNS
jgi:hypothetical protein